MKNVLKAALAACGLVACGGPMDAADAQVGTTQAELKTAHPYVFPKDVSKASIPELGERIESAVRLSTQEVRALDAQGLRRPTIDVVQALPPRSDDGLSGLGGGQHAIGSELGDPLDPRNKYGAGAYQQEKQAEEERARYATDAASCKDKEHCSSAKQQAQEELALLKALYGIQ